MGGSSKARGTWRSGIEVSYKCVKLELSQDEAYEQSCVSLQVLTVAAVGLPPKVA